ncbi:MAG: hypothetical protein ABR878_11080 [Roseiarcus sp.]|jgi:hypothetical protein
MLTLDDVKGFDALVPKTLPTGEPGPVALTRCLGIVKHFLGEKWLRTHIVCAARDEYLGLDFTSDITREEKTFRILELAEILFNLQCTDGFRSCIKQLEAGQIEGTYAELETAKWLYVYEVPFRFNTPVGARGCDYDLELDYGTVRVAADTKCKLEHSVVDPNSVKNTLYDNRDQLPKDRPGVMFVKLPAHWLETPHIMDIITAITNDFFANTGRVVAIKYYSPLRVIDGGVVRAFFRFRELTNPKHRFADLKLNWDLWGEKTAKDGMLPLPERWTRVIEWPLPASPRASEPAGAGSLTGRSEAQ